MAVSGAATAIRTTRRCATVSSPDLIRRYDVQNPRLCPVADDGQATVLGVKIGQIKINDNELKPRDRAAPAGVLRNIEAVVVPTRYVTLRGGLRQ